MEATTDRRVDIAILGPLRIVVEGRELVVSTRRQRALLVLLALSAGRVVSIDRLINDLWDGAPPPQATITLRSYVSNLRQALGGPDGLGATLTTRGPGYALELPTETIDAFRLRQLSDTGHRLLREGNAAEALQALDVAIGMWSGAPLAEIADHESVQSTITQLTETYFGAVEARFEALLGTGRHREALPDLNAFVADHPLREQPRMLLMLALYRDGRAPAALEVHRDFRRLLNDELGIDPSARMDRLAHQVLTQDPGLDLTVPTPVPDAVTALDAAESPDASTGSAGTRVVGRDRELAVLRSRMAALATGQGSLVLLSGEPGIGKSTILEAVEADASRQGIAVHRGRAPATPGAPAFWPWVEVIDSAADALTDEDLAAAISGPAAPITHLSDAIAHRTERAPVVLGDDAHALRFRLYEAVSAFLGAVRTGYPAVITLDDLHAADLSTLELLSYLTPSLSTRPLLIVATYRDLVADRSSGLDATLATVSREDAVEEIKLTGLTRGDVAELIGDVLGQPADAQLRADLVEVMHEKTAGNPFFIRQLARVLGEDGETGLAALSIPPGARHVIADRLGAVPAQAREILEAGAILGREFEVHVVAAMIDTAIEDALDALDEVSRHGLTEPGGGGGQSQRFVHALVHEVVLDQIPRGRAARLHAAAAAQVGTHSITPVYCRMAEHLWEARGIVGIAALPSQLEAADAATAVFAHDLAEQHLRRALELVQTFGPLDPDDELEILPRLHSIIATAGGWNDDDARQVIERTAQLLQTGTYSDRTAKSWWSLFWLLLDRNDTARYVELGRVLLEASTRDQPVIPIGDLAQGSVHLMNVFGALATGDRNQAEKHLAQARELIDRASPADLAEFEGSLQVMVHVVAGRWSALEGNVAAYRSSAEFAIALADADGRPFPRAYARSASAVSAVYAGDREFGAEISAQALQVDRHFGFSWLATVAECVQAWATCGSEDAEHGLSLLESTIKAMTAANRRGNESVLRLMLADLQQRTGAEKDAVASLARATEIPGPYQAMMLDVLAERLAAADR